MADERMTPERRAEIEAESEREYPWRAAHDGKVAIYDAGMPNYLVALLRAVLAELKAVEAERDALRGKTP